MATPGKWLKSLINPKKPTTSDQVTQAFLILCFRFPTLLCFLCFTLFLVVLGEEQEEMEAMEEFIRWAWIIQQKWCEEGPSGCFEGIEFFVYN